MNLNLRRKVDPKLAKAIEEDMAELDKKDAPKTTAPAKPEKIETEPCDCSGGPGENETPEIRGTGLIDDHTLCSKCNGEGIVPAAQG